MDRRFHLSLKRLKHTVQLMGTSVVEAIEHSIEALNTGNDDLAKLVCKEDHKIDELETQIDEKVILLLATQQPVAKDLRKLLAGMKIANDLERMADLAVNVATIALKSHTNPPLPSKQFALIDEMADLTQTMVEQVIESYVEKDEKQATALTQLDDKVDQNYETVKTEMIQLIKNDPTNSENYIQMILVARYFERIADHATNIAEHIVFIETGDQANLN